jgi:hypothetical protein
VVELFQFIEDNGMERAVFGSANRIHGRIVDVGSRKIRESIAPTDVM